MFHAVRGGWQPGEGDPMAGWFEKWEGADRDPPGLLTLSLGWFASVWDEKTRLALYRRCSFVSPTHPLFSFCYEIYI